MRYTEALIIASIICAATVAAAQEANVAPEIPTYGTIGPSEKITLEATVEEETPAASFVLAWSNADSDLDMVLLSPSGVAVNSSAGETVIFEEDETLESYIITSPEKGVWTAEVTAETVPESGEDFVFMTLVHLEDAVVNANVTESLKEFEIAGAPKICEDCE